MTDVSEQKEVGAKMFEEGETYNIDNFKISIDKLTYKPLSEVLEDNDEDLNVVDEFRFYIKDKDYEFAVEGYHIDDDTDSYAVSVYDTSDDHWLDTYNRVCTSYYDSCGGCEAGVGVRVFDIKNNQRKDVERLIETTLFGKDGIIVAF